MLTNFYENAQDKLNGPEIQKLMETVAGFYNLTVNEILSKRKHTAVIMPRQEIHYLCTRYTKAPLKCIGRLTGRDHATVIHSRNAVDFLFNGKTFTGKYVDPDYRSKMLRLCAAVEAALGKNTEEQPEPKPETRIIILTDSAINKLAWC
jgi:hypothetical protein